MLMLILIQTLLQQTHSHSLDSDFLVLNPEDVYVYKEANEKD